MYILKRRRFCFSIIHLGGDGWVFLTLLRKQGRIGYVLENLFCIFTICRPAAPVPENQTKFFNKETTYQKETFLPNNLSSHP